ncbi:FtsH protease activity modulator HflK [Limnohabitans sp. INBF002]|uniref:FtsH protease activity modulator HflK n=1 Tax=Limnohabitans sp. INBF002 TaxID=2986280 RepID=UPI002493C62E|nr:FtsH protease activity modulator HflK [Limnohabitans sp. INBF002]
MNFNTHTVSPKSWRTRLLGMFNLNDGRWGRDKDGNPTFDPNGSQAIPPSSEEKKPQEESKRPPAGAGGPPDLDELWRDFNAKLAGLFGNKKGGSEPPSNNGGPTGPDFKVARFGIGVIGAVVLAIWLSTGFFIVQEGQQAVITQFGRYHATVGAGFNWRLPYPFQRQELVFVTQIRSVDVGRDNIVKSTGLRESAMLTEDENILEIKFAVQYRLTDARAYLFETKNPTDTVVQAAETAVREVVGKMKMDAAMSEERDQIGPRIRTIMQAILDQYKVGVEVVGINLQQGGVRPPEQVQAAFDDVLKAGQERERAKNEAEAYANDVVPRAVGAASRLKQEADGYKARIVAQAEGDAQRFKSLVGEYQKAPQVMRDRLYIDAMQQIYSNTTKVLVDTKQGSNLLYLPLDKIIQQSSQANGASPAAPADATHNTANTTTNPAPAADARARDGRSRDRDGR